MRQITNIMLVFIWIATQIVLSVMPAHSHFHNDVPSTASSVHGLADIENKHSHVTKHQTEAMDNTLSGGSDQLS